MRIAVDAMGGDFGPSIIVEGALSAAKHVGVGLALVGPTAVLDEELRRHPDARSLDIAIVEASDVVGMGETPARALRRKPRSTIRLAAELVARGEAAAFVSAGNTGATVLAAHGELGLLPGVERPAIATTVPTRQAPSVLLDSGANAECRPQHLLQFAAMGALYVRATRGIEHPRVALLSIGEEETKGNELTRDAHRLLKASALNFVGNLEARDVFSGQADVIVCDGFTGNVALKIGEGLVDMIEELLRQELLGTFGTRVGYLLSRRAFRRFRKRVDYSEYGGAPLLGVSGLCIIGHGRSSAKAIRNAVALAARFVEQDLVGRLAHATTPMAG
jgi:glycerol-3-phosphate acyltransferase PlsX